MTQDKKYNGWTNYETWLCNMYYDNFFEDQAQEYWDSAEADSTFSREENAIIALTDYIKETVEEFTAEQAPKDNGFVLDLVNAALSEINYYEMAKNYMSDVDKTAEAA